MWKHDEIYQFWVIKAHCIVSAIQNTTVREAKALLLENAPLHWNVLDNIFRVYCPAMAIIFYIHLAGIITLYCGAERENKSSQISLVYSLVITELFSVSSIVFFCFYFISVLLSGEKIHHYYGMETLLQNVLVVFCKTYMIWKKAMNIEFYAEERV